MSRVGKKPISVPEGVKVEVDTKQVKISTSTHSLTLDVRPEIKVEYNSDTKEIVVSRVGDGRLQRALHGTTRAHIANMVLGVTKGFKKTMQIFGTGYGIKQQGAKVMFDLGYAKPASLDIPAGVTIEVKAPNARGNDVPAEFSILSADKWSVGELAAKIRRLRPPEPYRGKGVRYSDEIVKRKVGKAFGTGA